MDKQYNNTLIRITSNRNKKKKKPPKSHTYRKITKNSKAAFK